MLTHYLDIKLRAQPDLPANQILPALYAKLHRALVRLQTNSVAVSFPGYSQNPLGLGETLRLIGSSVSLAEVTSLPWSGGVADYINVGEVVEVPANVEHRRLTRVQAKSNPERLRRRQIRRHSLTAEQALERIPEGVIETLRLPFLPVTSTSTGQTFFLFLRLSAPQSTPTEGRFNSYGLSVAATIPWF